MNTAYRLALLSLAPRFLSEADPLGERLVIAAPSPNAAFEFSEVFCLLAPNSLDKKSVAGQDHELKIYWENGAETVVNVHPYPLEQTKFELSFAIPADAQVGRLYGKLLGANGKEYTIAPLQVVVRR